MNLKRITIAFLFALFLTQTFSITAKASARDSALCNRFSISTTYYTFLNFGSEKTNTHHYEFHVKYNLTSKHKFGIKIATWKLFAPMGIQYWDSLFLKESEFFPGRLRESGIGVSYQRLLWKGLFTTVEILPLYKSYLNENKKEIGNGFKLYTSFHLGYHISLLKNRIFIEPQIHCQYWPIDTNIPQGFKEKEKKWKNYFLLEPNIYLGINF